MLLRVDDLYVPDFGASLLSVLQLVKYGIDISFRFHSRTAYITVPYGLPGYYVTPERIISST